MSYTAEIALVLAVVAAACALPGTFLVLRRVALVSDAIGHVLLFGVVVTYFAVRDVESPWLLAGAAASGVLTVALVELLGRTRLVKQDAAVGLVFPALFAGGVVLASLYLRNTHLDVDAVLLGQPELATEARWHLGGVGLKPVWLMAGVLAVNLVLLVVFYKEMKLTTFDPGLASALGFRPGLVHYALMTAVAVTAVAAFDAVGPVLVVGFFVVPAAAAFLLTDRLAVMLGLAALIGVVGAVGGTFAAVRLDANTAGSVAAVLGVLFALAFAAAPGRGLVAQAVRRWRQKRAFHETMLAVHLYQHEGTDAEADEAGCRTVHRHLGWTEGQTAAVVGRAERHGLVRRDRDTLKLTHAGRDRARDVLGGSVDSAARPPSPPPS
ncbi:MAG: metal ABC transporter permease [Gemmataceae bacterium]|nr:metal ABC transporter permease [Gemmataceae bacterium]